MGMNPDTGEIRQFQSPDKIPEGWIPLENREARRLQRFAAGDRLRELDQRMVRQAIARSEHTKRRRHQAAVSRAKNRPL